jgi:hypothetical protein
MDRILSMIPRNLLAFLAIVGGIAFIIISQPPHSICDSQIEVINKAQARFLFKDPKSKVKVTTAYQKLRDRCQNTNDPGGCYEWFQELRVMLHDLGTLTSECNDAISGQAEYSTAIKEPLEQMVKMAWGSAPPVSYTAKFGWLDTSDITLFCRLRDKYVLFYGDGVWENFRERVMQELPGAKDITRNQIWDLSIFSENCSRYP